MELTIAQRQALTKKRNKAAGWVLEALEHVTAVFPFLIIGIDSDNGSEFINEYLFAYCHAHQITFTRSRPAWPRLCGFGEAIRG